LEHCEKEFDKALNDLEASLYTESAKTSLQYPSYVDDAVVAAAAAANAHHHQHPHRHFHTVKSKGKLPQTEGT
jgi:hypothetical protein